MHGHRRWCPGAGHLKDVGQQNIQRNVGFGGIGFAQRIYKHGEVELEEDDVKTVHKYLKQCFKAFIQKGFEETLKYGEEANENRTE